MKKMQLATIEPVMSPARTEGGTRVNHVSGAAFTSLRDGIQHRPQTSGTATSQMAGALASITATTKPIKLVNTFPSNIRQAACKRGSRRSKKANSTDFSTTAATSTRIEPDRASAGTVTCMNGTTGSHARVGFAMNAIDVSAKI